MWVFATIVCLFVGLFFYWKWKTFVPRFEEFGIVNGSKYAKNWQVMRAELAFNVMYEEMYSHYGHLPLVGCYVGEYNMVIHDPELIKAVTIKDFDHFMDKRVMTFNDKYFERMLFNMGGDEWRSTRATVSPIFTSGKLKGMVPLIDEIGCGMVQHLKQLAANEESFEAKSMFMNFALNVIGSCGFGIDAQAFTNPDSKFVDNALRFSRSGKHKQTKAQFFKMIFVAMFPKIANLFGLHIFPQEVMDFFGAIVKKQLESRKDGRNFRNDFIDTLSQALKDKDGDIDDIEMDIVSNLLLLFIAGFDTTSSTLALASYFLAMNPEIQDQVYEEILLEAGSDGVLDYERLSRLKYMEMCIHESLRLYPIAGILDRRCVKDWRVPGTDYFIRKGDMIAIPVREIQRDPRHYENPLEFNPLNFSEEAMKGQRQYTYFGFAIGTRNCVGKRFALMQLKAALYHLLLNFKVVPCEKTVKDLYPDPLDSSMMPKGGIWLKLERR